MNTKHAVIKIASVVASIAMMAAPLGAIANHDPNNVSSHQTVYIYDNGYSPQSITVQPGTTVTWNNVGAVAHTVTFDNYPANSGSIPPGGTFSATFWSNGTYSYHCQFHPNMTGTVTVAGTQPPNPPNPPPNVLVGTVGPTTPPGQIIINSITPTKTAGVADGTFENGWQWIFDISVPSSETNVAMRFNDWFSNMGSTMPVANNLRFYSPQSSNAFNQSSAIFITAPNTYSSNMMVTGNLGGAPAGMRRIQITVEQRIPSGTQSGTYTTNFGIRSQTP